MLVLTAGYLLLGVPVGPPIAIAEQPALSTPDQIQSIPAQEPSSVQIFRPSDWKGALEATEGECGLASGEFSYWVYATATRCGVPRQQAKRVVLIRLPTLAVAPITAPAKLPAGRYTAWAYGAGDPGHPYVQLCGNTCVAGELPPKPAWAFLGWVELRDDQLIVVRTWKFPYGHTMHLQAVVLSMSEIPPDWVP